MGKQKIPEDTRTFHFYNANAKNKFGGDCVVRAISTALNQSWEDTVREMTEVGISIGYVLNDTHTIDAYLKQKGWVKQKQPKRENGTKYTGSEFCKMQKSKGNTQTFIANIGCKHIVAIVNNKVNDIWNSSHRVIGNYWIKGGTEQ